MKPAFKASSQVLYVDLINPKGKVEKQLRLKVADFNTFGDFVIGPDAPGGLYRLMAYTKLMKEEGDLPFEKELQVQQITYPNILMKLDYDLEAYGPGDEVLADVSLKNLKDEPLANVSFQFVAQLNGKGLTKGQSTTDTEGNAAVRFVLPKNLKTNDGLLNVIVSEGGYTESVSRSIPIVLHNIDLQFFPEGGELVSGVKTKLAFKALNEFGKPADVSGIILNKNGKEVTSFQSFHMGMGALDFTPEKGQTYTAQITKPVRIKKKYILPEAQSSVFQLNIQKQTENYVDFIIHSPVAEKVVIMGQLGGVAYEAHQVKCKEGKNTYRISLNEFPSGVAQFTLFDKMGIPRAERLAFVNAEKSLHVELSTDKETYLPREKVEVSIKVADESGKPVAANLSMAVVDDKNISFADDKQAHIMASLLLASDLKGEIEEPNFYFDGKEPKAKAALDLVMLTHGWRSFDWEQIRDLEIMPLAFQKPERVGEFSGWVFDNNDKPVPNAEILIMEMTPSWETRYIHADASGYFSLDNVNGQVITMQARTTKGKDARIMIPDALYKLISKGIINNHIAFPLTNEQTAALNKERKAKIVAEVRKKRKQRELSKDRKDMLKKKVMVEEEEMADMIGDWDGENLALQEVVVTGYAIEGKKALNAASVVAIQKESIANINGNAVDFLQGRIAGVDITNFSGVPGAPNRVVVRGAASLQNNVNPLFIVDGVPIGNNQDALGVNGMNPVSMIPPGDINSIQVLKGPTASALYGARGSNGVIIINTKQANENLYGKVIERDAKVLSFYYPNQFLSGVRQFYSPQYQNVSGLNRNDFRTTVYWNPNIKTDKNGEAKINFYNSDATTAFRIITEGVGAGSLVGRREMTYSVQMPFSLNTKVPPILTAGDNFLLPVTLTNNSDQEINGKISFKLPENLVYTALQSRNHSEPVILAPNKSKTLYFQTRVLDNPGEGELILNFGGGGFVDMFNQKINTVSKGFNRIASISGKELTQKKKITIRNLVKGSLRARFVAYPDGTSELMDGVAAILREPHGCFEQTSSSTYPNILALNLMEEMNYDRPDVRKKARSLISKGYSRLTSFETSEKGYEWFGKAPAHTALSAYGLVEFEDMSKVYPQVDRSMVSRTRDYLLRRRTGRGGFKADGRGLDTFGHADQDIADAYITNALVQAGEEGLSIEIDHTYKSAKKSQDPYIMALAAHTLLLAGEQERGEEILNALYEVQSDQGGWTGKKHSVTRSMGSSLEVETTSIAILAMLVSEKINSTALTSAVKFLVSKRSGGWFASTQGTIQALKALSEYLKKFHEEADDGTVALYINGREVATTQYKANGFAPIIFNNLEEYLGEGEFEVEIEFTDTKVALPYSFDATWKVDVPPSDERTVVDLETEITQTRLRTGETSRLNIQLKNKTNEGQPMTMAIVGIPGGMSAQPWQLKELQEKEAFDYYEVKDNYVYLYFRFMKPNEKKQIALDLKAEVPGQYEAVASSAYLYYTSEYKDWEPGVVVDILE